MNDITSRGLPSRVDTEASGLTLATDEAQAEMPNGISWSLPCEGITGDLDPAYFWIGWDMAKPGADNTVYPARERV